MSLSMMAQAIMVEMIYRACVIVLSISSPHRDSYTFLAILNRLVAVFYCLIPVLDISCRGNCVKFALSVVYLLPPSEVIF